MKLKEVQGTKKSNEEFEIAKVKDLRQEAIKWIKEKGAYRKLLNKKVYGGDVVVWIKHFFNITKEDLK